jgi:sterol 14-demethylase
MHLMAEGYARHGEVFTVPVLHKKFTFLLGPHVSGHFFKANDEEMSQKEVRMHALLAPTVWRRVMEIRRRMRAAALQVYQFNVPTFGKGVVFDVDHKVWCGCAPTACHGQ